MSTVEILLASKVPGVEGVGHCAVVSLTLIPGEQQHRLRNPKPELISKIKKKICVYNKPSCASTLKKKTEKVGILSFKMPLTYDICQKI